MNNHLYWVLNKIKTCIAFLQNSLPYLTTSGLLASSKFITVKDYYLPLMLY